METDPRFPGYKFGPNGNPDTLDWVNKNWLPGDDDGIVCTFPKTGKHKSVFQFLKKNLQLYFINLYKNYEQKLLISVESFTENFYNIY